MHSHLRYFGSVQRCFGDYADADDKVIVMFCPLLVCSVAAVGEV